MVPRTRTVFDFGCNWGFMVLISGFLVSEFLSLMVFRLLGYVGFRVIVVFLVLSMGIWVYMFLGFLLRSWFEFLFLVRVLVCFFRIEYPTLLKV